MPPLSSGISRGANPRQAIQFHSADNPLHDFVERMAPEIAVQNPNKEGE